MHVGLALTGWVSAAEPPAPRPHVDGHIGVVVTVYTAGSGAGGFW